MFQNGRYARQPFDGSHAIMTGDNHPHRISMVVRKIMPVHPPGDQDFRLYRLLPRDTASIGDRTGRFRLFSGNASIRAFKHDFAGIVLETGALQEDSQWHAGPFRVADRTQLPLRASYLRDEKDPAVTRALQRGNACLGRHIPQFLIAQRQWLSDRAVDHEAVLRDVDPGRLEMTTDIKQFV